jgi:hypothetical protein
MIQIIIKSPVNPKIKIRIKTKRKTKIRREEIENNMLCMLIYL